MSDFDSKFVEKICQAQSYSFSNMETELLENVKNQIEIRKDNWYILFNIPSHINGHEVTKEDTLKVVEQILDMFKDHAKLYTLYWKCGNYENKMIPVDYDFKLNPLELNDESLFGLHFNSCPYPLGNLSQRTVKYFFKY